MDSTSRVPPGTRLPVHRDTLPSLRAHLSASPERFPTAAAAAIAPVLARGGLRQEARVRRPRVAEWITDCVPVGASSQRGAGQPRPPPPGSPGPAHRQRRPLAPCTGPTIKFLPVGGVTTVAVPWCGGHTAATSDPGPGIRVGGYPVFVLALWWASWHPPHTPRPEGSCAVQTPTASEARGLADNRVDMGMPVLACFVGSPATHARPSAGSVGVCACQSRSAGHTGCELWPRPSVRTPAVGSATALVHTSGLATLPAAIHALYSRSEMGHTRVGSSTPKATGRGARCQRAPSGPWRNSEDTAAHGARDSRQADPRTGVASASTGLPPPSHKPQGIRIHTVPTHYRVLARVRGP